MIMRVKILCIIFLTVSTFAQAQQKREDAVAKRVEQLRVAMVDGSERSLAALSSNDLSYGHSAGVVEDKNEFIRRIISGESDFTEILLSEQTIRISGNAAVVRHRLDAKTNDSGKPGQVRLLVLQVWQEKGGEWLLLARQAVRIMP